MHAIQKPLNQRQYQSRALSASPSPPPIPSQPNRFQYENNKNNEKLSIDIPLPPRRRYQIVPIREETNQMINKDLASTQPKLTSFAKSIYNRNSSKRNDYENIRDIIKPIVVKDPRRKPYYYNELSQNLDANDITNDIPNIESDYVDVNAIENNNTIKLGSDQITIENNNEKNIPRNYNSNSTINCGSGGSLDNII